MKIEELKKLISKADELEKEIDQLREQFNGLSMGKLMKKLTKLGMSKQGITPEGLGLPSNIMDKLTEYQRINKIVRAAMLQVLGGGNDDK